MLVSRPVLCSNLNLSRRNITSLFRITCFFKFNKANVGPWMMGREPAHRHITGPALALMRQLPCWNVKASEYLKSVFIISTKDQSWLTFSRRIPFCAALHKFSWLSLSTNLTRNIKQSKVAVSSGEGGIYQDHPDGVSTMTMIQDHCHKSVFHDPLSTSLLKHNMHLWFSLLKTLP